MQVGSILKNHVGYGAILSWNSSVLLQCLQEYLETEEQWLFYLLAEKTGTTKVSIITLWHQHFPTIKTDFTCDCIAKETRTIEQDFESQSCRRHIPKDLIQN